MVIDMSTSQIKVKVEYFYLSIFMVIICPLMDVPLCFYFVIIRQTIMDTESDLMVPDGRGYGGMGEEVRGLRSTSR